MNQKKIKFQLVQWVVVLCLIVTFLSAKTPTFKNEQEKEDYYFNVFRKAYQTLRTQYVEESKVDSEKLFYGAIKGMVGALGDPHSSLFQGKNLDNFINKINGHFTGIGVYIAPNDDGILIVGTVKGGPAWEIGLQVDDVITEIEGESIKGKSLEEAKERILGVPNSVLNIKVLRNKEIKEFNVVRKEVKVATVNHKIIEGEGLKIGYIKIDQFGGNTDQEFKESIDFIKKELLLGDRNNQRSIIIDLRFNPGGLLNIVADMVDRFVTEGTIVSTKDRNKVLSKFEAHRTVTFPKFFPLIVLINEHSASASEIMSGALKDFGRALIIGKNSYGKFSVQRFFDLEPGKSSIKLTIARYYLPDGESYEGSGITPHVTVTNSINQEILREFYSSDLYWKTKDKIVEEDPALKMAISVLKSKEYRDLLK